MYMRPTRNLPGYPGPASRSSRGSTPDHPWIYQQVLTWLRPQLFPGLSSAGLPGSPLDLHADPVLDPSLDPPSTLLFSGGMWYFTDEPRENQGAASYEGLIGNESKEIMSFTDFPVPEHYDYVRTRCSLFVDLSDAKVARTS